MNSLRKLALVGASLLVSVAAQNVNGTDVNFVEAGAAGERSIFQQVAERSWAEKDTKGATRFTFKEQMRDAGSVLLFDESRGVSVRLDMRARKVMYKGSASEPEGELYPILNASNRPNGRLCRFAQSSDATYVQTGAATWEERGPNGSVLFRFQEVKRDDWSVYLEDRSRNIGIRLDLRAMQVMYREGRGQESPLYEISKAGMRAPR